MNPNPLPTAPAPAPGPEPVGQGLVEFVRTGRPTAAYVLLGLSVVFLGLTIWLAATGIRAPAAKPDEKPPAANPLDPEAPPPPELVNPRKGEFLAGAISTGLAFLTTALVGGWLLAWPPKADVAAQRTEARSVILVAGGLLGFLLILFGAWFFYLWSDNLTAWLDKGEAKAMQWVIYPLLMVGVGAGLILLAVQPARAEERNNPLLRRLVYGSNLGLTVLLLFVVLVVANVAYGIQGKSRLDTTTTGFYTLSEPTQAVLAQLDQPVTAYAILPEGGQRLVDDIRRLLQSCEDAGGGKFRVKYINPQLNKTELAALRTRYTQLELNDIGVLLTVGEDTQGAGPPGRYVFIRADDFLDREAGAMGRPGEQVFAGEGKLIREVMFLAENKQKPVVYFTQSNKELSLTGGGAMGMPGDTGPEHSAAQLKAFLEKNYLDVRPLTLDPVKPTVPDDADIVVVAAPRAPFSPAAADALSTYMTKERPGGKKGKLIVLAGNADPREARKPAPTGLEGLLQRFNVSLGSSYLFAIDGGQPLIDSLPCGFTESAVRAKNPVAQTLRRFMIRMVLPREVSAAPQGSPEFKATPVLATATDLVWSEPEFPENMNRMLADLQQHPERKQVTRTKTVGVLAAESGGTARLAVYGSGFIASDAWAQENRGTAPVEFDLVGVTIDWLRERPPIPPGVTTKQYTAYTFPPKVDTTRLLWLPLGLTVLSVAALGAGVWVIRRK
jgi:hypothetical protein